MPEIDLPSLWDSPTVITRKVDVGSNYMRGLIEYS